MPDDLAAAVLARLYPAPPKYQHDIAGFANDELGIHLWSKQREIAADLEEHDRVTVRASHGVGKTLFGSVAVTWFLTQFPESRVITTAPTWAQVRDLLWRNIRANVGAAQARGRLTQFPPPDQVKWDLGPEWFAVGLSTDQPERFQGHHAKHLLLLVDESSGVDEAIFEAAEGFLTAEGAKALLLGNPTKIGGTFHRSHTTAREQWRTHAISVFDTPNYTGEEVPEAVARALPRKDWAAERYADWGEDSPMAAVRVRGEFPSTSDRNVVDLSTVVRAQERTTEEWPDSAVNGRVLIACDVARFGDDETVIVERIDNTVRIVEHYTGQSLVHTAGRVAHWLENHQPQVRRCIIDDTGLGGGVTDMLRTMGYEVEAFNGGERARQPQLYPNRRSEAWFAAATQLPYIDLDPDDRLAADLTGPEYSYNTAMQRVVEKKADTKKRLGRSPDRGDAVVMALSTPIGSNQDDADAAKARAAAQAAAPRSLTAGLLGPNARAI